MQPYKQYFHVLVTGIILSLFLIGSINYVIDPANIYHDSISQQNSPSKYAVTLVNSKYGLLRPNNSWKEREIKRYLALLNTGTDCAIIGSSHIMQISSYKDNQSLTNTCNSLINLGVSGGTLEDFFALSFNLIKNQQRPNKIIFAVNPWSLDFKNDPRWQEYNDSYEGMVELLENNHLRILIDQIYLQWKLLTNLINYEYFRKSIESAGLTKSSAQNINNHSDKIIEAPRFDLSKGIKDPVTLPDGSHVYSQQYILENIPSNIPLGGINYKIKQENQYSESAISLFSKLLSKLKTLGIEPILLMTPYHHNVWEDKNSSTTKALIEVEPRVRKLAKDLSIRVLGSFNPLTIGCNPDEFYDHMHARVSCLAKIEN